MSISYLRVTPARQPSHERLVAARTSHDEAHELAHSDVHSDAHTEDALDEALAESFPASDPVAVSISTAAPGAGLRKTPPRSAPS